MPFYPKAQVKRFILQKTGNIGTKTVHSKLQRDMLQLVS